MKREIEFRGKAVTGIWVYGGISIKSHGVFINDESLPYDDCCRVIPETVGQFSGLKDIKQEKLYEDDLLQSQIGDNHLWKIVYDDGSFVLEQIGGDKKRGKKKHTQDLCCADDIALYSLVKIGNIHDNPELLEG